MKHSGNMATRTMAASNEAPRVMRMARRRFMDLQHAFLPFGEEEDDEVSGSLFPRSGLCSSSRSP